RFTLTTPPSGIISENNYKIHYLVCGAKVARTESSPVVPKTVNKRPTGEIFLTVLRQPDEQPLKMPFLP
ncbi:MAG: hypothetical protein ACK53Y_08415, partial [bacterium]